LYGALVVTLAMLLCLINCLTIIIIIKYALQIDLFAYLLTRTYAHTINGDKEETEVTNDY